MSDDHVKTQPARITANVKLVLDHANSMPTKEIVVLFPGVLMPEHETVVINAEDYDWFGTQCQAAGLSISETDQRHNGNPVYEIREARILTH